MAKNPLSRLEAEAIHILHETVAETRSPVMLFSAGKDSTVMAHVAARAFYPAKPPLPSLHVNSTWDFAASSSSERQGRISDGQDGGSLEQKKREGYF